MADEPRPVSRRARRETTGAPDAASEGGGQDPQIQAGLAYTSEMPITEVRATAEAKSTLVEPDSSQPTMSRRDRRRLERLEHPVETWTAEEEMRHTGQVPVMTPEVIAQQEALARQQAAAAQSDAQTASGAIRQVNDPSTQLPDEPQQVPQQPLGAPQPGGPLPGGPLPGGPLPGGPQQVPQQPLGGPQPGGPQQVPQQQPLGAPQPGGPQQVPRFPQAAPQPGGPRPVPLPPHPGPLVVPQLAGEPSATSAPSPPPTSPPLVALGAHTAGFEALVSGGLISPPFEAPPVPAPHNGVPFQPPGIAESSGPLPPPGQSLVIPGTGVIQNNLGLLQTTGTLRTIPGTGTIPRPIVEIQPAGGVRHFGWAQLGLLAAAAFALGVVIWNVAAHGS